MTIDYSATRCIPIFDPTRDTVSGHKIVTWTETEIEMIIIPRGEAQYHTPVGYYGQITDLGMCADPVYEFEHVKKDGERYEIKYIKMIRQGDNFIRRDCALVELPLFEEMPQSATWKTAPDDPRSKIKAYLDSRVEPANLTKNDGATQATVAVMFEDPPYHLRHEFRAASSPVQGLYVVGAPDSEPLHSGALTPSGYRESVPIHVVTMDCTGCGGEQLRWKMEAELRRVVETYEVGSHTNLQRRSKQDVNLGSEKLFDTLWTLQYERGTT